ncbi:GerMN domain-containing protein [Arthrobacter sp. TWP1-1]|uniref:GerMN domain-containing protein n=1 Tax=Arthrobacter sp. TWP1-1 TaxID=2804568 RepID=UPI003CF8E5EC
MQRFAVLTLAMGAALILGGCTGGTPYGAPPASSSAATVTPSAPAGGETAAPSPVPTSNLPEPTVLPTNASVITYFIAVGDGGTAGPLVGCGDSAVAVTSPSVSFTDPVEAALRTLLASHTEQLGQSGLRNALWQSTLAVTSIDRSGSAITAHLDGSLAVAGECDIPRIEQQLLLTAQEAAGGPVAITINGKPLSEALSLK